MMTKKSLKSSKNGSVLISVILFIVVILGVGFVSLFGYKILSEVAPDMRIDLNNTNESIEVINDVESRYPSFVDGITIFIFIGLWIVLLILGYNINSNPAFFVFAILIIIFMVICGAILGNFYEEMTGDSDFEVLRTQLPVTHWILTNMFLNTMIMGVSVMMVMFWND